MEENCTLNVSYPEIIMPEFDETYCPLSNRNALLGDLLTELRERLADGYSVALLDLSHGTDFDDGYIRGLNYGEDIVIWEIENLRANLGLPELGRKIEGHK